MRALDIKSNFSVLVFIFSCFFQALQPDPEETDHAEGAGQGPHLSCHRCQTAGQEKVHKKQ